MRLKVDPGNLCRRPIVRLFNYDGLEVRILTCFIVALHLLTQQEMLKPLVEIALQISQLRELTGRQQPNVIT